MKYIGIILLSTLSSSAFAGGYDISKLKCTVALKNEGGMHEYTFSTGKANAVEIEKTINGVYFKVSRAYSDDLLQYVIDEEVGSRTLDNSFSLMEAPPPRAGQDSPKLTYGRRDGSRVTLTCDLK